MIILTLLYLCDSEDSNSVCLVELRDAWCHAIWCVGNPVCPAGEHPLPNGLGPPVAARELQGLLRQTDGREGCGTFQQNPYGHWQKILRGEKPSGSYHHVILFNLLNVQYYFYTFLFYYFFCTSISAGNRWVHVHPPAAGVLPLCPGSGRASLSPGLTHTNTLTHTDAHTCTAAPLLNSRCPFQATLHSLLVALVNLLDLIVLDLNDSSHCFITLKRF